MNRSGVWYESKSKADGMKCISQVLRLVYIKCAVLGTIFYASVQTDDGADSLCFSFEVSGLMLPHITYDIYFGHAFDGYN